MGPTHIKEILGKIIPEFPCPKHCGDTVYLGTKDDLGMLRFCTTCHKVWSFDDNSRIVMEIGTYKGTLKEVKTYFFGVKKRLLWNKRREEHEKKNST